MMTNPPPSPIIPLKTPAKRPIAMSKIMVEVVMGVEV
jgi:hypothetical protein